MRIMTGAPIPPGADTIVPFEETDELERKNGSGDMNTIGILSSHPKGSFVRPAGEDIRKGDTVLKQRTVLQPAHLGVLSAIGLPVVTVSRKPIVAILSTGDELQAPGKKLRPGKIYDSNGVSIAASITQYGGLPKFLGITRDSIDSINSKLDKALESDMIITSAGVSKGDYDLVKTILESRGNMAFWSVKMRPAKPLAFGLLNASNGSKVPHIGLPGNPVSAMVAFEEFCRPAILKMLGQDTFARKRLTAILEDSITNYDGRRVYSRVIVYSREGRYYAKLTGPQGSNLLTSMVKANGLAICPENTQEMRPGEKTEVILLDWPE
jgi:molybdopterin molybdotransferase